MTNVTRLVRVRAEPHQEALGTWISSDGIREVRSERSVTSTTRVPKRTDPDGLPLRHRSACRAAPAQPHGRRTTASPRPGGTRDRRATSRTPPAAGPAGCVGSPGKPAPSRSIGGTWIALGTPSLASGVEVLSGAGRVAGTTFRLVTGEQCKGRDAT